MQQLVEVDEVVEHIVVCDDLERDDYLFFVIHHHVIIISPDELSIHAEITQSTVLHPAEHLLYHKLFYL
jgi:hypothetical protein